MLRKMMLAIFLGFVGTAVGLVAGHSRAMACSISDWDCGYFKNQYENAYCNILPDPSIRWYYTTNNCWLNSGGGTGHSSLYGVNNTSAFINDINWYLYPYSGYASGFKTNGTTGSAFLIDTMMGIDYHNWNPSAGINDARSQFSNWSATINQIGASGHTCSDPYQATCPGLSYGINWGYNPPNFCNSYAVLTSAYDPWQQDALTWRLDPSTCWNGWKDSIPEIVIYWNNGANSVRIGSQCGNIQDVNPSKLPPRDQLPTGSITVVCNRTTWQQDATVNFSDSDQGTDGYVTINGINVSGTVASGAIVHIPQSDASPYPPSQVVTLHIRDSGPLAPPGTYVTYNANTDVPCADVSCGFIANPVSELDPYMGFSVQVVVSDNVNLIPSGTVGLQITPPVGATYSYSGTQTTPATVGGSISAVFNGLGPTRNAGQFHLHGTFNGGGVSIACDSSLPVVYLPYLKVYGGDVFVGGSPAVGSTTCSTNGNGGIFSWNNHNAGYSGAGTQYAVQTMAQIEDFSSAFGATNTAPTGLSFANNPAQVNAAQGLFGGYYGSAMSYCDFTSDITNKVYSSLPLSGHQVSLGTRETYDVIGHDVYISGNITYQGTGGWTSVGSVPYFKVVADGGNIYIGSNVTELDGIYVAESNSATTGHIYTCASAMGVPYSPATFSPTSPTYYQACNKQLVVNGTFVAAQVWFLRTFGSLGQPLLTPDSLTTNHGAEVFNYTPEVWLPRGASTPNSGYDAITGLPPVL